MAPETFEPDPEQSLVLAHESGTLLVTGAPGTGKTWVLRERFARLIEAGKAPERVALIVGSKRARSEARAALRGRLRLSLPALHVTTLQGLAYHIVSRRYRNLGYREPPRVLDAADQFALVQDLLRGERETLAQEWPTFGALLELRGFADEMRQFVLRCQEALAKPDEILERADRAGLPGWRDPAGFYRRYLEVLDAEGSVDFAGLVEQAAVAGSSGEPLFDHVLVDDFHDTTLGAEALLAALSAPDLVVGGDPESHVFSFQGTSDTPIRRFAERFRAANVRLGTCHRGPRVQMEAWRAPHTCEESTAVARELRRIHAEEGVPWSSLAVLVRRQGPRVGGLLRALDDAGVPRSIGESGLSVSASPATLPFVLALRWIVADADRRDELAEPILTSELGGLSPASARSLLRAARAAGRRPAESLELEEGLSEAERQSISELRAVLRAAQEKRSSALDAFAVLWRDLPYSRRLVEAAGRSREADADLDAIVAFFGLITRAGASSTPSVEAFLDLAELSEGAPTLAAERDRNPDVVEVLTAHGAVGLEFDTVILVGAVEGDFPSLTRPEPMFDLATLDGVRSRSEANRARLADERRLFRMALGRARRRVVLTASDPHGLESEEKVGSRFVEELGLRWADIGVGPSGDPVSAAEASGAWRRSLADQDAPAAHRLASLAGLLALGEDPGRWWLQRDWTEPAREEERPLHLSYSRLDHLENCELQFVLSDELGLDVTGGYQAWVGRLVHRLIEECENGEIERTPEAFVAALNERWQQGRFPSYAVSEAERRHAIRVLIPNWFARYGDLPAEATERRFQFEYEGALMSGVIDRIGPVPEGGRRITDYKTGSADSADRPAESLQLGIYYLAVNECEDLAPYRPVDAVELSYLPGKKGKWELVPLSWDVSAVEEDYKARMRQRLSDLIATVRRLDEQGSYVPNTTANCFFCRFQMLCSRYPEGGEVLP
ncbi:MAG: ATP-dependent DNA helicase [Actinomycetota bacterium]